MKFADFDKTTCGDCILKLGSLTNVEHVKEFLSQTPVHLPEDVSSLVAAKIYAQSVVEVLLQEKKGVNFDQHAREMIKKFELLETPVVVASEVSEITTEVTPSTTSKSSKKFLCEELFKRNVVNGSEEPKDMVAVFVSQAGMTEAGARTYLSVIKKHFGF